MTPLLLDTCALIWLTGNHPVSAASAQALARAQGSGARVNISPISAWEIGLLVERGRLALAAEPRRWLEAVLARPGVSLAPLTPHILLDSSFLPGAPPPDPADRIMLATARAEGLTILTRDRRMLTYAAAGHAAAIAC